MNMLFTQIPDKLRYPANVKAKLSTLHSKIITDFSSQYHGSFRERKFIIHVLNSVSYYILNQDTFEYTTIDDVQLVDDDLCKSKLSAIYLNERTLDWDIQISDDSDSPMVSVSPIDTPDKTIVKSTISSESIIPTPKEDLYIQSPKIPRFDTSKVYASGTIDGTTYAVYYSLPDIPTRQNEISCTTDASKFTSRDLRSLYPNQFIPTRAPVMYQREYSMEYHPTLGTILPIEGYSRDQLIDNLVKYPHIFRLTRCVDDGIVSFYSTIEIDGELHKVSDIWNSLPESDSIPYTADFIKEYVVRRYLLERDIDHIDHKYPMFGSLDPYLTLFTSIDGYIGLGYTDIDDIARNCVLSRVHYKASRNPVLRRLGYV